MSTGISSFQKRGSRSLFRWFLFPVILVAQLSEAAGDRCAVCQKEIRFTIYTWTDKVTRMKLLLCGACVELPDNCYLCSVPLLKNFTTLPDGRMICRRDVGSVVLDDQEAAVICEKVKEDLDRQFIRFITIPATNVTLQLMDRVKLQELFKIIGNDFTCPNTLGCTETLTNGGQRSFAISILSGQPREDVMTTCVHEYAHTWILENVPPARLKKIGKDAVEGFCELLSYLFAEQQGLAAGKSNILANYYTRGQIHLFIEANQRYGFADIVDWMRSGADPLLRSDDLRRVRQLEDVSLPTITNTTTNHSKPARPLALEAPIAPRPPHLILQGIIWSKTQPMATISGRNFDLNQEATVLLRDGPVTVRCLEIHPASVVLQTNHAPERLELKLK